MADKLEIEYIPIAEITPYAKNPRRNKDAVETVMKSIKEFGFKNPIILDKNNEVIAGHTRLEAAKLLDYKEVPIIWADDLTPAQVKAFRIMDNRSAEMANWDIDLLKMELTELKDVSFDLDLTGFDPKQREVLGMISKIEDLPDVDITGEMVDLHDVIIVQLKNTRDAKIIREILNMPEKKKSISSKDFLDAIKKK